MGKNLVMLTLLFDENIDRDIVRRLELRLPNLDFTTVRRLGWPERQTLTYSSGRPRPNEFW